MILNDPCFQRKLKTYLLTTCFKRAVVVAVSSDRAKRMMVEHTSLEEWGSAEDIEIIITDEEQIISEST